MSDVRPRFETAMTGQVAVIFAAMFTLGLGGKVSSTVKSALCSILGWAHAWLNRPFRWLPWANEAVYPWYVLHQSLIVLCAYWLLPSQLGPVLEPLLVLAGTIAGCWLLHGFVIRRSRWLRPLFGLKMLRPMQQPRPITAPS